MTEQYSPGISRYKAAIIALLAASLTLAAPGARRALAEPPLPPRPVVTGEPERGTHCVRLDDTGASPISDHTLERVAEAYRTRRSLRPLAMTLTSSSGALSGRVIAVSPGHGIRWSSDLDRWAFQRDVTNHVREDIHTAQIVIDYLHDMLERAGAEVVHTRERDYDEWSIVIDNDDESGDYVESGDWATGGSPGYRGTYRYAFVDDPEDSVASWHFEVPEDGEQPVYVHFLASDNRSPSATYRVEHAYGVSERWLKQNDVLVERAPTAWYPNSPPLSESPRTYGDLWHYLGTFPFRAGHRYAVHLGNAGSDALAVVIADGVRVGAGLGEVRGADGSVSERPRWEESASTFLAWLDVPAWMRVNDVVIRPLYAAYRGVDAYVAVHSNASGGSASGTSTWTWYPEMWVPERSWPAGFVGDELPPGTFELAQRIHAGIVDRLRAGWDAEWRDGGLWGANFGELRPLRYGWRNDVAAGLEPPMTIPAVLVEVAFHSEPYDARLLAEMGFRHDIARGYLAGLVHHFAGDEAVLPPLAPIDVTAATTAGGLLVRWSDAQDPVAPTAVAERWRVYTSNDGVLFDPDPLEVTGPTALLPLAGCDPLYVRVTGVNAGGESLDSRVVGGQRPHEGGGRFLIVDGVDRERKTAADPNNLRSWARVYGPAVAESLPGAGFDMANDRAAAELLAEFDYDLVVWATGETSTRDLSLSPADQFLLTDLRLHRHPLLISGAELAWHLARGDDADQRFLREVLEVDYIADSSETTVIDASELGYLSRVTFGDCSRDAICVEWPDVLGPESGGEVVLRYETGGGAAVRSQDGSVIVAGFPLESVADPAERLELIGRLSAALLDDDLTSAGECPEPPGPADDPGDGAGTDAGLAEGDTGGVEVVEPVDDAGPDPSDAVTSPDIGENDGSGLDAMEETGVDLGDDTRDVVAKTADDGCGCGTKHGRSGGGIWTALLVLLALARQRGRRRILRR